MQTRMAALNFRFVAFITPCLDNRMAGMRCLFKWNLYVTNMKNLGHSFKNWGLFLGMNRISEYLDAA